MHVFINASIIKGHEMKHFNKELEDLALFLETSKTCEEEVRLIMTNHSIFGYMIIFLGSNLWMNFVTVHK